MTLFPSFSAAAPDSRKNMIGLYSRSIKILLVLIGPLVAILILFAKDILHLWLGAEFAKQSSIVLQIISAGMLINSLAQMPFALIQGFGRPDLTAKFHVFELLLYIPLMWLLVKHIGIIGGAIAWFIRVTIDAILLFTASMKFLNSSTIFDSGLKRTTIMVSSMICILFGLSLVNGTILIKLIISGIILTMFTIISWRNVLDAAERELICSAVRRAVGIIEVTN